MASSDHSGYRRAKLAVSVAVLVLSAGCGHKAHQAAPSGLFDNQQQASLACMAHQSQQPGTLYIAGAQGADTAHILQMMQYFASNGNKPYCDGAKPSAIDQAWGRLFVSLGGAASAVLTPPGTP